MIPIHLDESALDAGLAAYLTTVGSYAPHRLDLHIANSEQLAEGMRACIRAYLSILPTDHLIDQLRRHADAEVVNTLRYIVNADHLMRQAADRISMLEGHLAEIRAERSRPSHVVTIESAAMNETGDLHQVPAEVRAAINAFLNECEKNAQPFVVSKALNAVRRIFPDLEISDADLLDAITSEASIAGLDIDFDIPATPETVEQRGIERWDNEGGAVGSSSATEAQRRLDNDTNGAKRRARDTKDRNDLV